MVEVLQEERDLHASHATYLQNSVAFNKKQLQKVQKEKAGLEQSLQEVKELNLSLS